MLQNVNDEPPLCHPPHLETWIYSIVRGAFVQLNCSDGDSPPEHLSYLIVGGKTYDFKYIISRLL